MLVGSVKNKEEIKELFPLVDLIELRLDFFDISKKPDCPCIFTLRKKEEGGAFLESEEKRLEKIERLLSLEPEYFDLEADIDPDFLKKMAQKFPSVHFIGSFHDFEKTPDDLEQVFDSMQNPHFSSYKMAFYANSSLDMLRLLAFAKGKKGLSVMSMGPFGKASRVLGRVIGNEFDYTGLKEDLELCRYDVKTLLNLFHYRRLNLDTSIYALIGDPIEKSPGELFHNPRFESNAVYVKIPLREEELVEFFLIFDQLPFQGLSVTIPLKEKILPFLDELDEEVQQIQAVNTVLIQDGKKVGMNTDGRGAVLALEKHVSMEGKKIAILGAGGTAKAIAFAAKKRGANVCLFNRSFERAKKIAEAFQIEAKELCSLKGSFYDILIQTIPNEKRPSFEVIPNTVVMDVVYFPKKTPFLLLAEKQGCHCVYGEEMFEEQALLQQKAWKHLIP